MKICFFSKYPPITGALSSQAYWLAKGLGEAGCEIHVVTDALEAKESCREKLDFENPDDLEKYQPQNVYVHSLQHGDIVRTSYSQKHLARLINLGLKTMKDYDCDVIDASYFFPYGLAAMVLKALTGKPLIIRATKSDMTGLSDFDENFRFLFLEIIKSADFIVTGELQKNTFKSRGIKDEKLIINCNFGTSTKDFRPDVRPMDLEAKKIMEKENFKSTVANNIALYKFTQRKDFRLNLVYKETLKTFRNFFDSAL